MKKSPEEMEGEAFRELALIYAADIEEAELLEYAVITCAIRHHLAGVSASFLETSIDELSMATHIEIK